MKLTPLQIERIELYFLGQGLKSRSFFNEMLDHWVSRIEASMDKEADFDAWFNFLRIEFDQIEVKTKGVAPNLYGLKGLEAAYYHKQTLKGFKVVNADLKQTFGLSLLGLIVLIILLSAIGLPHIKLLLPIVKLIAIGSFAAFLIALLVELWQNGGKAFVLGLNKHKGYVEKEKYKRLEGRTHFTDYALWMIMPWALSSTLMLFFEDFITQNINPEVLLAVKVGLAVFQSLLVISFVKKVLFTKASIQMKAIMPK